MFEMLEFEWRGRTMSRPGAARMSPHPRTPRKMRRRPARPQPWPPGGMWPYRAPYIAPLPFPAPDSLPEEPVQLPAGDQDGGDGADEELTSKLREGVQRMPPGRRPHYHYVGSLQTAPDHDMAQGAGLYYFEFKSEGKLHAYSGESACLSTRLRQHRGNVRRLKLNPENMKTFVTDGPRNKAQRRAQEKLFHERMKQHHPDFLTNVRLEMEFGCGCAHCQRLPFCAEQEMELAYELLDVRSEAELEQFLGKMFKGIWKGIKKVAKPLGGILKGIAKKALPFVGGALGSLIPIPGVGTALGSALGGALGKALEMELAELPDADREVESARRFVRIAGRAAQAAGDSDGSPQAVRKAVLEALRAHAPRFGQA